jgi:hypothetical protein
MDWGHSRRVGAIWRTSGEFDVASRPINLWIVGQKPVIANKDVTADVQNKEVTHFGVTTHVHPDGYVVCDSSIFVF